MSGFKQIFHILEIPSTEYIPVMAVFYLLGADACPRWYIHRPI